MSTISRQRLLVWAKPLVFFLCLLPLAILLWSGFNARLGANPVEAATHYTGEWGLRMLLFTLAITPLRRLSGWNGVQRFRRMLGLFAFFYVCLHFTIFLVFDHFFDWWGIWQDVVKRPYITVGFLAFVLLIPLAVTSTQTMIKRLGRNWQRLHRSVYLIGVLAILHFLWLVKANNILEPLLYGLILVVLLGYRLWFSYRHSRVVAKGTGYFASSKA